MEFPDRVGVGELYLMNEIHVHEQFKDSKKVR